MKTLRHIVLGLIVLVAATSIAPTAHAWPGKDKPASGGGGAEHTKGKRGSTHDKHTAKRPDAPSKAQQKSGWKGNPNTGSRPQDR